MAALSQGRPAEMISHTFRWVLVPLSAFAVWYAALIAGMLGVAVLDALCPPEQIVSGMCTASWHAPAVDALIVGLAATAAFGIVVVPARIAPGHRRIVAVVSYLSGAAIAVALVIDGGVIGPFSGAALGGTAGLVVGGTFYVQRRAKRRQYIT